MIENEKGPQGVGGWLLFLVVSMVVLTPFFGIGQTYVEFTSAERAYPAITQIAWWSSYKTAHWIATLIFCAISIYGGLGLALNRTIDAVTKAKFVLWFNYPISVIVLTVIAATMVPDNGAAAAEAALLLIPSLIMLAIWTSYLNLSKRVKNTYGRTVVSSIALTPTTAYQIPHTGNPTSIGQAAGDSSQYAISHHSNKVYSAHIDEDRIYRQIADELESGAIDKGLWTRLYAECGGDEIQTKVLYIKQRADRLFAAEQFLLEQGQVSLDPNGETLRFQEAGNAISTLDAINESSTKNNISEGWKLHGFGNDVIVVSQKSRNIGSLIWLGTLFLYFIPGLFVYLIKKDDAYILDQSKEAIHWSITFFVIGILGTLSYGVLSPSRNGYLFMIIVIIVHLVFCTMGTVATSKGQPFRVPFAIRLIK